VATLEQLLDAHQLAHAHPSGSSADIIAGQIRAIAINYSGEAIIVALNWGGAYEDFARIALPFLAGGVFWVASIWATGRILAGSPKFRASFKLRHRPRDRVLTSDTLIAVCTINCGVARNNTPGHEARAPLRHFKWIRLRQETYHDVIAFDRDAEGDLKPGEAREVLSPIVAERRARALALEHAGDLAFSRAGDPTTGAFQDAVILAQFGEVDLDSAVSNW
jgi:hypothetical protein